MSQHGAKGRALAGQDAATILAAYYTGSRLASVDPATNVRVRVLPWLNARSRSPLLLYGRGGAWTVSGVAKVFPADAVLKVWHTSTAWKIKVLAPDGTRLHRGKLGRSFTMRPAEAGAFLQVWSRASTYDTYRGSLRVFLRAKGALVVNHVALDLYLRGVVPVEMPSSWPVEALEAQSIAARSFAYRRLHPGKGKFDLRDDTSAQVYRGIEGERSATNAVIAGSPGTVLKSGKQVVNAVFHSTAGGATENNEYVFVSSSGTVGTPVSYLRGIEDRDPDGQPYDAAAPFYAWKTSTLTRAQLSSMFATDSRTAVGDLRRLDLTRRGVSGRLYRVTLIGSTGTKTVSADVFRAVYNASRPAGSRLLRGNLFDTAPLP